MNQENLDFVRQLVADGTITGPVLELGAGYGGPTSRPAIPPAMGYRSTDIAGKVDYIANFESRAGFEAIAERFRAILILNVLEHTFEPIRVLDNALSLLAPGGAIVTSTPVIWPIHNYPIDCCRLLPDFYIRYAETRGLDLVPERFAYLGFGPIAGYRAPDGLFRLPKHGKAKGMAGRVTRGGYRLFRALARGGLAIYPYVAIVAVFRDRGEQAPGPAARAPAATVSQGVVEMRRST
jgi:hypothetical protein